MLHVLTILNSKQENNPKPKLGGFSAITKTVKQRLEGHILIWFYRKDELDMIWNLTLVKSMNNAYSMANGGEYRDNKTGPKTEPCSTPHV